MDDSPKSSIDIEHLAREEEVADVGLIQVVDQELSKHRLSTAGVCCDPKDCGAKPMHPDEKFLMGE